MTISAIFCIFFYSFIGHSFKNNLQNWLSPLLFVAASIFLPFINQYVTSEVVAMGLRSFNMGGGKNIQILNQHSLGEGIETVSKLILLTPNNAYVKNNENKLLVIPISDHTEVKIW